MLVLVFILSVFLIAGVVVGTRGPYPAAGWAVAAAAGLALFVILVLHALSPTPTRW